MAQMNFSQNLKSSSTEEQSTLRNQFVSDELLAQRKDQGEATEYAKQFPQMYIGTDKKFYVKNKFNNDFASYARYESREVYDHGKEIHSFEHVSHEEAMSKYEKEILHEFTIHVLNEKQVVFCNLVGELIAPIDGIHLMKDYLKRLAKKHGKDAVKFTHKEVCSEDNSKNSE